MSDKYFIGPYDKYNFSNDSYSQLDLGIIHEGIIKLDEVTIK